ncbi:sodium:solute symporter [Rubellicoccus peritrichatus]|uniref:Sodium/solute symporter n=1 Tax=Rubellicoccus peritrichatus TaxID=3080537 RepID=A0AAQ3QY39_9BACT|nr:sodium/solute symporter [Puniceicoccus sp. CR14]WOO43440.1 sodium/solute symporter [Puniceicoccus sp. CR14]
MAISCLPSWNNGLLAPKSFFFVVILLCFGTTGSFAEEDRSPVIIREAAISLPNLNESSGIAGSGDAILLIGGEDIDGAISSTVSIYLPDAGEWIVAELDAPIKEATVVSDGGTIYLIGGISPDGVTDRVVQLEVLDGQLSQTILQKLPVPLYLSGAAIYEDKLWVGGGIQALDAESVESQLYSLSLKDEDPVWVNQGELPMGGRISPLMSQVYNELLIGGGWSVQPVDGRLIATPSADAWGFSPDPREGHKNGGWEQRADLPIALADSSIAKTGQSHVVVAGGDQSSPELSQLLSGMHEAEPTDLLLSYHGVTNTWLPLASLPKPQTGGALLPWNEATWLMFGNDVRPGNSLLHELEFENVSRTLGWLDWVVVALYFCVIAGIGFYFARKQDSAEEFALGNRQVKWWAAAVSLMATGVSTISFMAIPALVSSTSLVFTLPSLIIIPGIFISAYLTFPLLRKLNITSTYEYLENRYGLTLRLVGSAIGIIGQMLGRMSVVILLPALAINAVTGIDVTISVLCMGILTTVYSTLGGFEAVVWTDVTQGLLMIGGFFLIAILAFINVPGGFDTVIDYGRECGRLEWLILEWDWAVPMVWFAIIGQLIQLMSFASDQATAQRVLCTPMKDVRKLAFLFGGFSVLVAWLAGAVGIGLFAYFKSNPAELSPLMKNDQIVPYFIVNKMPVGVAGLMIATLFAASMSTVSTSVNTCAVLFGEDFVKRFRKGISSIAEMRIMQAVSLFSGLVGTAMAVYLVNSSMPSLFELMTRLAALLGGGFVGVYALGMFTRRAHELGAIFGVLVSIAVAVWLNMDGNGDWLHWSGWAIIITGSCIVFGYLFSLVVPWRRNDLTGLTIFDQIPDPPEPVLPMPDGATVSAK